MAGSGWWFRWIRFWARWYPREFHARFGADLLQQYPEPAHGKVTAALGAARDLISGSIGARLDDRRRLPAVTESNPPGSRFGYWTIDFKMASRRVRRSPGLSIAIVLTFGLSAGVASAVFSAADAALVRALPYPNESRLVSVGVVWTGAPHSNVSTAEYLDFLQRARSFDGMALHHSASVNLTATGAPPERVQGLRATPSLFTVLDVPALMGRPFTESETQDSVIVISHGLWTRRFNARRDIIGQFLATDAGPMRIVAVMPPSFIYPSSLMEVWLPLRVNPASPGNRGAHNRQAIGRVREGVTVAAAGLEMRSLATQLQSEFPANYPAGSGWSAGVMPLRARLLGDVMSSMWILAVGAVAVLLIGCANVASLFVAREASRSAEMATLVALGATSRRLRARAWREGAILGCAGGGLAALVATWLFDGLQAWLPDGLPRPRLLVTDARSVWLAVFTTTFAGSLTAWCASLRSVRRAVTGSARTSRVTEGVSAQRLRSVLVGAQVTVAVTLLVCGGYALKSYMRLLSTPLGFDTADVVTARVALSPIRYPEAASQEVFARRWLEAAVAEPGVMAAGLASMLPLTGQSNDWDFGVEGHVPASPGLSPNAQARVVTGAYFDALEIPLLAGRTFRSGDDGEAPRVAVVSQALARKYWGEADPIGRRIRRWSLDSDEPWTTIVGVVGDVRYRGPMNESEPFLYFPLAQLPTSALSVLVRLDPARARLTTAASSVLHDITRHVDPEQPLWAPRSLDGWRAQVMSDARLTLSLLGVFAVTAVLLAMVGLNGVIASSVASRTKELGVRVALGAHPSTLMRGVVSNAVWLASAGVLLGTALAASLGVQLSAVFPGVVVVDTSVWFLVGLLLVVLAGVAAYVPARRAMRVDPIQSLRAD